MSDKPLEKLAKTTERRLRFRRIAKRWIEWVELPAAVFYIPVALYHLVEAHPPGWLFGTELLTTALETKLAADLYNRRHEATPRLARMAPHSGVVLVPAWLDRTRDR